MIRPFLFCLTLLLPLAASADCFTEAQTTHWRAVADSLTPSLHERVARPVRQVRIVADKTAFQGYRAVPVEGLDTLFSRPFPKNKPVVLDFGEHLVGTVTLSVRDLGAMQDARQRFRVVFGEVPSDLALSREPFTGTLSRGWLQDHVIDIDYSGRFTFPSRVTARYMMIESVSPSPYCAFTLGDVTLLATTSAGESCLTLAEGTPQIFRDIARVSQNTLRDCMQTLYEDGPKRDQRLWAGDFYLQALANGATFRNYALTRRCLYLLASTADCKTGLVCSNLIDRPSFKYQHSLFIDYALAFMLTLADYYDATGDTLTLSELWPVAFRQVEAARTGLLAADGMARGDGEIAPGVWGTVFFDWCPQELDKRTALQGYLCYVLDRTRRLAVKCGRGGETADYPALLGRMRRAGHRAAWDARCRCVVSGERRQVSKTATAWAVLGGLVEGREAREALHYALTGSEVVGCGTPYANHFLIEALLLSGMNNEARREVDALWGDMVRLGADTFWEFFVPTDHFFSSYNHYPLLNSYCHAWSCTPVYFIAKYPEVFQRQAF